MYLSLSDINKRCTLSKSTIYRLIKAGQFPQPVQLSPGRVGWREDDLATWEAKLAPSVTLAVQGGAQ